MSLTVIFAGTPAVAIPTLNWLIDSDHQVVAVYTQPDRKAGRGRRLQASPVKTRALQTNIPIEQPHSLNDAQVRQKLAEYQADIMIVVAYGLLLPKAILQIPRKGCLNLHFSLLPRWRGAAPIQHAILNGDKETGVSIMQIDKALDAGDILANITTPIYEEDNSKTLGERLALMGADLLCKTLASNNTPKAQDNKKASYASKIHKSDALIDWNNPAIVVNRKIRAYYDWPVAFTHFHSSLLRIWQAKVLTQSFNEKPGTFILMGNSVAVACKEGGLLLETVQLPGKQIISGREFANFYRQKILC